MLGIVSPLQVKVVTSSREYWSANAPTATLHQSGRKSASRTITSRNSGNSETEPFALPVPPLENLAIK
jgi:hypothetical protein